jgi:enamine deaminase RidA (YjgF/YER057c/UK114 family)
MTDTRQLISSGSPFERDIGYSRAVVQGPWVFVSGTTGFDYATMTIQDEVAEQAEQCLRNIETALHQAGAGLADIVRVTYILPRAGDFPACWPVLRKYLGEIRPAATMLSAGLADARMKIEIEVTALKRGGWPGKMPTWTSTRPSTGSLQQNAAPGRTACRTRPGSCSSICASHSTTSSTSA